MSDASFIAKVGIEADPAGIEAFRRLVTQTFQQIAQEAQRAAESGGSLAGTSSRFQSEQLGAASAIGGSGLSAKAQQDLLGHLERVTAQFGSDVESAYSGSGRSGFAALSRGAVDTAATIARQQTAAQATADRAAAAAARTAAREAEVAAARAGSGVVDLGQPTTASLAAEELTRRRQAAAVQSTVLAGTTQGDVDLAASNTLREARLRVATQLQVEEGTLSADNTALGELAAARKRNITAQGLAQNAATTPDDLAAKGQLNAENAVNAQRVKLAELGLPEIEGENVAQRASRIAVEQQAAANRQRLEEIKALQSSASEEASLLVQRKLAEQALTREINARAQEEIKARIQSGEIDQGTLFQRVQQNIAGREGGAPKLPTDYSTLGQTIGARFATTAGFAISGLGTYGAVTTLKDIYSSEQQVQQAFTIISGQLNSIGQGGTLGQVRAQIAGIAADTGTAEASIAQIFPQLQGAFKNTADALANARDAAEFVKIAKADLQTTTNDLTPAALAFKTNFATITDTALGIQEQAGVQASRTVALFGALAPVATQAGLSLKEVGAIAAAVLQDTARTPQSVAEDFNRLIPQIQKNAAKIVDDLSGAGGAAQQQFTGDIQAGKLGAAIELLIRSYSKLSDSQKQQLEADLGTQRGAKDVTDLLLNQGQALAVLDNQQNQAGKTQSYFTNLQKDLGQQLAQLREELLQLGRTLLEAGVAQAFGDILTVLSALITGLKDVGEAFVFINDHTGGLASRVLEIAVAAKALAVALELMSSQKVLGVLGALGGVLGRGKGGNPLLADVGSGAYTGEGAAAAAAAVPASGAAGTTVTALGGPFTIIAASIVTLGLTINSEADKINSAAEKYRASLANVSRAAIEQDSRSSTANAQAISKYLFDTPTRQDIDRQKLNALDSASAASRLAQLAAGGDLSVGASGAAGRQAAPSPYGSAPIPAIPEFLDRALHNTPASSADADLADAVAKKGVITAAQIKQLTDAAAHGDKTATQLLNIYNAGLLGTPEGKAAVDRLNAKSQADLAAKGNVPDPTTLITPIEATATAAIDAFTSGQSSLADAMSILQKQLSLAVGASKDTIQTKYEKLISDALLQDQGLSDSFQNNTVGDDAAKIANQVALFNNPQFTDKGDRAKLAAQIVTNLKAELTAEADAATSTAERNRILADGLAIPPEVRQVLAQQLIDNDPLIQLFFTTMGAIDSHILDQTKKDTLAFVAGGKAIGDAVITALTQELTYWQGVLASYGGRPAGVGDIEAIVANLQDAVDKAKAQQGALNTVGGVPTNVTNGPTSNTSGVANQDALNKAQADYQAALAGKDPIRQAQIAQDLANQDYAAAVAAGDDTKKYQAMAAQVRAGTQLDAAYASIALASDALRAAQAASDPVAAAEAAQQTAADQLAVAQQANDTVGIINAQTAQISADRQLQAALQAVGVSQLELVKAQLTAAGDVVGAAKEQVAIIQREITDAKARGAGGAELNTLYAQLAGAQAAVGTTTVSFAESQIQDNLDLQRITVGQAVAQLRALEAVQSSQTVRDEIEKRVRSLLNQSVNGLQFNLPTDIILPTLYEARRVNATPAGQTYSGAQIDNRQQNFIFNLTGSNLDEVKAVVAGAIGSSSQLQTSVPKRY